MKKKKVLAVAVVALGLSLTGYGTLAYFTAGETAHNTITSGEIAISLHEWADEEKTKNFPEEGITGVVPATSVTKIVEVENTGTNPAYIRILLEKEIVLAKGEEETEVNLSLICLNIDEENWTYNEEDGYYYYNTALEAGETTAPFFTTVTFDSTMNDLYQECTVYISVRAAAVQSQNNGESVSEAAGWPADGE